MPEVAHNVFPLSSDTRPVGAVAVGEALLLGEPLQTRGDRVRGSGLGEAPRDDSDSLALTLAQPNGGFVGRAVRPMLNSHT